MELWREGGWEDCDAPIILDSGSVIAPLAVGGVGCAVAVAGIRILGWNIKFFGGELKELWFVGIREVPMAWEISDMQEERVVLFNRAITLPLQERAYSRS